MPKITANFTGVNEVPTGEMLIKIEKVDLKQSQGGNAMLNLQCAILASEDDRWNGRKVFPILMLETDMRRQTFQALNAMGLSVPEGDFSFDSDELVGKEVYVFATEKERQDKTGKMTNVTAWGVTPKLLKPSIT